MSFRTARSARPWPPADERVGGGEILPAEVVVYFVLALGLFRSVSTQEVLRCLVEGLRWLRVGSLRITGRAASVAGTKRLGTEFFRSCGGVCTGTGIGGYAGSDLPGLALRVWDGTTLDLLDEAANREAFGKLGVARGEVACPQVRLIALMEVGTRVPLAWMQGPYWAVETAQAQILYDQLGPGQLVLADQDYLSIEHWQQAAATGAHLLWRVRHHFSLPIFQELMDGSWHSRCEGLPCAWWTTPWQKTRMRPADWLPLS